MERRTMRTGEEIMRFLDSKPENVVWLNDIELSFVVGFFSEAFRLAALAEGRKRRGRVNNNELQWECGK